MKRSSNKIFTGVSLLACAAFGSATVAAESTVTFQGEVLENTCTATIDGSATATVQLNPVSTSVLSSDGSQSAPQYFTIDVTACGTHNPHQVRAYFYQPGASNGYLVKDAGNGGSGAGWGYRLTDSAGTNMTVGTTAVIVPDTNSVSSADVSSGSGTLTYGVRYVRTGNLTPGNLNATATYVIYSN